MALLCFAMALLKVFAAVFLRQEGGGAPKVFRELLCNLGKTAVKLVAHGLHLKGRLCQ